MTHITISPRIIAVEVPKDTVTPVVEYDRTLNHWVIHYGVFAYDILPPDKTYKFLCLASEAATNGKTYKNVEIWKGSGAFIDEWIVYTFKTEELRAIYETIDLSKEYALIEVE